MKQVTKEEVLEQVAAFGREVERLQGEKELAIKANDVLEKRALEQAGEIKNLQGQNNFLEEELEKAKAAADHPVLRALRDFIVEQEDRVPKLAAAAGATLEGVSRTVVLIPTNKKEKFTDDELTGKILRVIYEGEAGRKWESYELAPKINARWGVGTNSQGVGSACRELWEKKILGKDVQGKKTLYFVPQSTTLVPAN